MPKPQIEIIWRENNQICRKYLPWAWNRPQTTEAIEEWLNEYLSMVFDGYKPSGHQNPPIPHCCRIHSNGQLVAEWLEPARANESLVTFARLRSGVASPEVTPSAPCSEELTVPITPDPCGLADSVRMESDPRTQRLDTRAVLTTGCE